MEEIKFIIYGGGYRGKRLLTYLGKNKVLAYVESYNNKLGICIEGIPVISLDDYEKYFFGVHIIISPSNHEDIERTLVERNIRNYSRLSDLPSEFSGYGVASIDECYDDIVKKYGMPCYIRGNNAFGLLLAEKLIQAGNDTCFVDENSKPDSGILFIASGEKEEKIRRMFPELKIEDAFYHSSLLPRYHNETIAKLKDKYNKLNRCFIIATGPSLRKKDIEILRANDEFCIGVNKIFLLDTVWRPNIYMVTDSVFMIEEKERIKNYHVPLKIYGDSNEPPDEDGEVVHIVSDVCEEAPPFSDDAAQRIYAGGTVTYAAIQLAVYLGINNIYLLGVDCDYKKSSKSNHFYSDEIEDRIDHKTDKMMRAFEVAQAYAIQNNIHIFNATRGGKLETFKRVNFDTLF